MFHLSCFWLLGYGNIALFRTVLWLAWSLRLGQNTPSWDLFSEKKNRVPLSNFFSSSNMFFIRLFLANTRKKNRGSSCSFKRKEFISLSSLVWGKSLAFCTCTCPCARADDAKIVRSRDAKCNTKELPYLNILIILWFITISQGGRRKFLIKYSDNIMIYHYITGGRRNSYLIK